MSQKNTPQRSQPEFLFLFDSKKPHGSQISHSDGNKSPTMPSDTVVDKDEAKVLRKKLISELREYGC